MSSSCLVEVRYCRSERNVESRSIAHRVYFVFWCLVSLPYDLTSTHWCSNISATDLSRQWMHAHLLCAWFYWQLCPQRAYHSHAQCHRHGAWMVLGCMGQSDDVRHRNLLNCIWMEFLCNSTLEAGDPFFLSSLYLRCIFLPCVYYMHLWHLVNL